MIMRGVGGGRMGVGGGGKWVRWCLITFAVISAPALFWKFHHSHSNSNSIHTLFSFSFLSLSSPLSPSSSSSCPSCNCQCPPPPSLLHFAPGLDNLSLSDCGGNGDPDQKKEMEKQQFVDLLTEELKLQQGVSSERAVYMNSTLNEARRSAALYQREADKCIAATETCESARERSELFLRKETKLTLLWQKRALNLGWQPPL